MIEIVLDIGRPAEIRYSNGQINKLGDDLINDDDIKMYYDLEQSLHIAVKVYVRDEDRVRFLILCKSPLV